MIDLNKAAKDTLMATAIAAWQWQSETGCTDVAEDILTHEEVIVNIWTSASGTSDWDIYLSADQIVHHKTSLSQMKWFTWFHQLIAEQLSTLIMIFDFE